MNKNRAVIYARYSTNKQREESIEGQVRVCRELLIKKGYEVVHIYADRAETGTNDDRQEFQEMMRDAENGLFDAVFCYKNDRFARNRYDAIIYKHKLKKRGISVYFAAEPQVDGPEGVILESMLEGFAEYFSANLAVNVRRGMKENALNCQYNGGPVPIGYVIDDKKQYVIDEYMAPVVYEVFRRYASGETIKSIYERLNNLGFRTTAGKKFSKGSICSIVSNEKYIGEYIYTADDNDIIKNVNGIPPIIDRELWDKAKARQKTNIGNTNQGKSLYLLTGRLICSCGASMCGTRIYRDNSSYYYYYRCNKKMQDSRHSCSSGNISCRVLDKVIFNTIFNKILTDENINQIAAGIEAMANKKQKNNKTMDFTKQKKDIETRIQNLMDAIEAGIITPTTKQRLEELESQRAALDFEKEKNVISNSIYDRTKIIDFLRKIRLGDINDDLFKKDLADILIRHVKVITKGKVELSLKFGGNVYLNYILVYDNSSKATIENSTFEQI